MILKSAIALSSFAALSLTVAPAFAESTRSQEIQNLTCVTEGQRLVCQNQQTAQLLTFEQSNHLKQSSETVTLTPVKRTALFNSELDAVLSSQLLWLSYLSLPIVVIIAICWHDRHSRQKMTTLLQQVATLERIWQRPQTRQ